MINILTHHTIIMHNCAGISRDKKMADKLMHNSNNYIQNYPFCRLQLVIDTFGMDSDTKLNEQIRIFKKFPKF